MKQLISMGIVANICLFTFTGCAVEKATTQPSTQSAAESVKVTESSTAPNEIKPIESKGELGMNGPKSAKEMSEYFAKAYNSMSVDNILGLFEKNGINIDQNGGVIAGKEANRTYLENFMKLGGTITAENKYAYEFEDIALLRGEWKIVTKDQDGKELIVQGSSLEVARKQKDGTWLYIIDNPFGANQEVKNTEPSTTPNAEKPQENKAEISNKGPKSPKEMSEYFAKAYNSADVENILSLFEANGISIDQNGNTIAGKEANRNYLGNFLKLGGTITAENKYVIEFENIALLRGEWKIVTKDQDGKELIVQGSSAEVVRKQEDGTWLYIIDNPFGALPNQN